ncbi:MAG: glycoside hydrolase family 9 protein [Cyclobacteriaceae bacterium]|nr:glycoside hydrolase family 9 protein [Cyclobacteriaceae bacterium]
MKLTIAASLLYGVFFSFTLEAQRLSRDYNVDLLVNQAGYLPNSSKVVSAPGVLSHSFQVIEIASNKVVFSGSFKSAPADFGDYSTGDFSTFSRAGVYYITCDTLRSFPFKISTDVYDPAMQLIVSYFSKQRCGNSKTGYLTPCHLDDGLRMDDGKHQDVSGGWHDASDLRKWVGATIYGMIGMAKAYELPTGLDKGLVLEELLWGNRYFLNMQEPLGYIMSYIGGDVLKHSDSNRWTDNAVGEEGGEVHFTKPNAGRSTSDMLIAGTVDDRIIKTEPLDIMGQYNFITAEAIMARITDETDVNYSKKCLEAAQKCFDWCKNEKFETNPGIVGAAIQASLELYKTTGESEYKEFAIRQAKELLKFQEVDDNNQVSGYFYTSTDKKEPYRNIWNGCMEFFALSDLVTLFPGHPDTVVWKEMISRYARNYLIAISQKNHLGIVPFGVFTEKDPGGNRKAGNLWYRYTMQPNPEWWVGINANLAASGVGLLKASVLLDDPQLRAAAQRQLDWIIGNNPFNSSTLIGIGYNHPKHFPGSTFSPQTPVINGAVMNGLGGNEQDAPEIGTGNWQISEYWTPMVAYTLWLMAELESTVN